MGIVGLPLFFLLCESIPVFFKMKQQFAPILSSSCNGVNCCIKDKYAHMILPLVFMVVCDFNPDLD